jgi:SAM-dependent methyltransferase
LRSKFLSQFGNPTGALGGVAGFVMAYRGSNRRRNFWTVEQLDLRPTDEVLEIGYGPGIAVRRAAQVARHVVGVDRSAVMRRQALRRNRKSNVTLITGTIDDLPPEWAGRFTKALGVNVFMFWPDPVAVLRKLSRFLAPGAMLALTQQPRGGNATGADELSEALREAGFTGIEARRLALKPPAVCVLAHAPAAESLSRTATRPMSS